MRTALLATLLALSACNPPKPEDTGDTGDTADADTDTDTDTDADTDTDTDTDTDGPPILFSSGGGGSSAEPFVGEYVEEECPTDCSANTDPVFAAAEVFVNGVAIASPAPVVGDTVAVAIAYADAECNLACGALYYSWMSPRESQASVGSLPSNLPCATAESGVFLGFDFGEVEAGEYTWMLRAEDACGGETTRVEGTFTVTP